MKQLQFISIFIITILLTSCATMQPGQGINTDFARQWGCNYHQISHQADVYKAKLPSGKYYVPQVGWDVCELMARLGRPDDIDHQSGYGNTSATWWYNTGQYRDLTMVSLKKKSNKWIITYVGR